MRLSQNTETQGTMKRRAAAGLAAATGVLLLAWALFVTHIGLESMWYDEAISWEMARPATLLGLMDKYPLGTGHPPFYFMWLWVWVHVTGSEHWLVMRLSSALPMLLAVALTMRLAADWFGSRWAALGAGMFLATSGLVIYYARELRMYALLILLVVVSWWLLRQWLEGRRSWVTLLAYAATVALMGYTHYLSAFVVLAQVIVVALFYRRKLLPLFGAYLLTALAIVPWLPTFIEQQYVASTRAGRDGSLTLDNIGQFNATRETDLTTVREWLAHYTAQEEAFVMGLVVLALVLGIGVARGGRYRRHVIIAALWLFAPLLLLWGANLRVPLYSLRYVLWTLPPLALLVGVAVQQMPRPAHAALLLFIGVVGVLGHPAAFLDPKTPHYDMLTTIDERRLPGDQVWYNLSYGALGSYVEEEVLYYLEEVTPDFNTDEFIWNAPVDLRDPAITRVWDVRPYWIPLPPDAEAALRDGRTLSEQYNFHDFRVRLYEIPPAEQPPVQFGDLFALKAGRIAPTYAPGETITLKLWWRALEPAVLDYSLGLYLRDEAGQVVAQTDGGLVQGVRTDEAIPTSQWPVSDDYRLATPQLVIPPDIAPGEYGLWAAVYYWEDPQPLAPTANERWVIDAGSSVVRVAAVTVE